MNHVQKAIYNRRMKEADVFFIKAQKYILLGEYMKAKNLCYFAEREYKSAGNIAQDSNNKTLFEKAMNKAKEARDKLNEITNILSNALHF